MSSKQKIHEMIVPEITIQLDPKELEEAFRGKVIDAFWCAWCGDDNGPAMSQKIVDAVITALLKDDKLIKAIARELRGDIVDSILDELRCGDPVISKKMEARIRRALKAEIDAGVNV